MDLQNLSFFQMSGEKMRWLAQRQSVLAKNVANANTPNYMPSDLKPLQFKEFVGESKHVALKRTNPAHRTRSSRLTKIVTTNPAHITAQPDGAGEKTAHRPFETSIDKNGVVIEEQMAKVDQPRADFDKVTALFQKNVNLISLALNKK